MTSAPYFQTFHCKDWCSHQLMHPLQFNASKVPNEIPLIVADLVAIAGGFEQFKDRYICLPIGHRKFRQYLNYCPSSQRGSLDIHKKGYAISKSSPITTGSKYTEYFGIFIFILDRLDPTFSQFGILRLHVGIDSQLPIFATLLSCEKQLVFDLVPIIKSTVDTMSATKLYSFLHSPGNDANSFVNAGAFFDTLPPGGTSLVFSQARVKIADTNYRLGLQYKDPNIFSFNERTAISEYTRLICEHIYKVSIVPFFPVTSPFKVLFQQVGEIQHVGLRNWFDSFSISMLVDDNNYIRKAAKVFAQTNHERHQS